MLREYMTPPTQPRRAVSAARATVAPAQVAQRFAAARSRRSAQSVNPVAHCPSAEPLTTLALPVGAGSLLSHCRLPPMRLPKMVTPPPLLEGCTSPSTTFSLIVTGPEL